MGKSESDVEIEKLVCKLKKCQDENEKLKEENEKYKKLHRAEQQKSYRKYHRNTGAILSK